MEGFKFKENESIYTSIDGQISKHTVRGFYTRPNGTKIYVIVTYGRESLLKEEQVFGTLDEAKNEAKRYFKNELDKQRKNLESVDEIEEPELTEERSPKEIADDQARAEAERENQLAIDESNSDQEAEATDNQ